MWHGFYYVNAKRETLADPEYLAQFYGTLNAHEPGSSKYTQAARKAMLVSWCCIDVISLISDFVALSWLEAHTGAIFSITLPVEACR